MEKDKTLKAVTDSFWSRQAGIGLGSRVTGFNPTETGEAGFITKIRGKVSGYVYTVTTDNGADYEVPETWLNKLSVKKHNNSQEIDRVIGRYKELFQGVLYF